MILDVFFPRLCPLCEDVLHKNEYICNKCYRLLPFTEQFALRGNITEDLFSKNRRFVSGAAFLFFERESMVQKIMHKIKYAEQPFLGYVLAKEAAREGLCTDFFENIDIIMPVPLHIKRLRERGYNQSEWIARGLSDVTGIPMDTTHLLRVKNNPKQALKGAEERKKNVDDIFQISHPEDMYRKHILLVDDIITTGSTIESCMSAMSKFRGCRISVFALAKTR